MHEVGRQVGSREDANPFGIEKIREDLGHALAVVLGSHTVVLMRGHGSVAAAQSLRHVVFRAVYTEVNARISSEALRLGEPTFLNDAEAAAAMQTNDGLVDRPWELWRRRVSGK